MKLVKIKLINWHIFANNTIEFKDNLLVTGENGAGKSTFMDAIYFCLSGGDSKNFNKAAGQGGQRTLETYLRCKVGNDSKPFLRDKPDVIGYIVLEFFDETTNESSIMGTCLEIKNTTIKKPSFFVINHYHINDDDYLDGNSVYNYNDFRNRMRGFDDYIDLSNYNSRQIKEKIGRDFFHIPNYPRFYELLSNALSFKPIGEVSSFVYDFLLKEDRLDLGSLINQIRNYQDINNVLEREEQKLFCLEEFVNKAKIYVDNDEKKKYYGYLIHEKEIANDKFKINTYDSQLTKLKNNEVSIANKKEEISEKIDEYKRDKMKYEDNEAYRVLKTKKDLLISKDKELGIVTNQLTELSNNLSTLDIVAKEFYFNINFRKIYNSKNYDELVKSLDKFYSKKDEKYDELTISLVDKRRDLKDSHEKAAACKEEIDIMNKGRNTYRSKHIERLKDYLQNKIKEAFPYDEVYIRPFCEYVEVIDEEWSNALEGYLNTQRYNLIIPPKYYDFAAKEYEKVRDQIYDVGIVNIDGLDDVEEPLNNSLYEKVQVENEFANKYALNLLGKVICAQDVIEAKKYKKSITRDVMIYSNSVLKACNPQVYETPYLGEKARKKRYEQLQNELKELQEDIFLIQKDIDLINEQFGIIRRAKDFKVDENNWLKEESLKSEIFTLKEEIEKLSNDDNLIKNQELIDNCDRQISKLKIQNDVLILEEKKNSESIGSINTILKNTYNDLNLHEEEFELIKHNFNDPVLLAKYQEEHKADKIEFLKSEKESAVKSMNSNSEYLQRRITEYTNKYNASLSPILDNLKDYINEYYRVKNQDVLKFKEKANEAYRVANRSFKEDFLSKIKEKIEEAEATLRQLNKKLAQHTFGTNKEKFSFEYKASEEIEFKNYYNIITSGYVLEAKSLLDEPMKPADELVMKELFAHISEASSNEQEKNISRYLDYRNYMSFDIIIEDKDGNKSHFSQINKEKSGGETQTPFYIIMAACFEQLIDKDNSTICVIFDEAFNNMDEDRIKSMMEFYKELKIQLIIIVPSIRSHAIIPYADTVMGIVKENNRAYIVPMPHES